jgi:hypothetical protein
LWEQIVWVSFWFIIGMIGRALNADSRGIGKRKSKTYKPWREAIEKREPK